MNGRLGGLDFSAFNPLSTNSLNMAARVDDVAAVKELLNTKNVNIADNRGWTCLHEAAAHSSLESLKIIMKHPETNLLIETFEGHTALYLACRNKCSLETIKALLDHIPDIIHYASTEMVSPLHLACSQGRLDLVDMLINYGADLHVKDFDGDTPLHDASLSKNPEVVAMLLHAGAQAEMPNEMWYTPLHLACATKCLESVEELLPFTTNSNNRARDGKTPICLAAQVGAVEVVKYMLKHGGDPNIACHHKMLPLEYAMRSRSVETFKLLLNESDRSKISKDMFVTACKPNFFKIDILRAILESDLGPEFFNMTMPLRSMGEIGLCIREYKTSGPLNLFIDLSEYIYNKSRSTFAKLFLLLLSKGVSIDALSADECPPLVYLQYSTCARSFEDVLKILVHQDCNIDYKSLEIEDVFHASILTGGIHLILLLNFSVASEPIHVLKYARDKKLFDRIHRSVLNRLFMLVCGRDDLTENDLDTTVYPLKHLARVALRDVLRRNKGPNFFKFWRAMKCLPKPLRSYMRYISL